MTQNWRSLLPVPWRLVLIQLIQWRLLDLAYSILSTQTLRSYKKWLFILPRMMVVSCYPALQHVLLDWYNLAQDLIICHPELVWLKAQLTIPWKPTECLFTVQYRKCPLKAQNKWLQCLMFPSLWCARSKFYKATQMSLRVLGTFQVPNTT